MTTLDPLAVRYLDLLRASLTDFHRIAEDDGTSFFTEVPTSIEGRRQLRREGRDWPRHAETMIGLRRLAQLQSAVVDAVVSGGPGDILEAGIWRGGACILARAVLLVMGCTDRTVWVADSFAGLPPPRPDLYPADAGDEHHLQAFLAVGRDEVEANFAKYGLLDRQVRFLPGWFLHTLASAPVQRLAVLRLDGDMYESTIVTLEALYDRVSPRGYVIIDDYGAVPGCRRAVEDCCTARAIVAPLQTIDWTGVYWRVPS